MKSKDYNNLEIEVLNPELNNCERIYKILVIGDSGVGKSCLTLQAIQNKFVDLNSSTVGFEIMSFNIRVNKVLIKLLIWDTCGQEVYKSLINSHYRNTSLAIIIYSVNNKNSFRHVENWLRDLKLNSAKNVKTILVGNKCDLEKERKISFKDGENLKIKHKLDYFIEASAKTGSNATNILIEASKILYKECIDLKNYEKNNSFEEKEQNNCQKLKNENCNMKKKKKCC